MPVTVFFLPGFMGSDLHYRGGKGQLLWVDKSRLSTYAFYDLETDPMTGQPAGAGKDLGAGNIYYDTYGEAFYRLRKDLEREQIRLVPFPYDWRQRPETIALSLVRSIEYWCDAQSPAVIVGHSLGGIIGRLAYSLLKGSNELALFRRLICLGTPHQGTWSVVELWSNKDSFAKALLLAQQTLGHLPVRTNDFLRVTTSWPSIYSLLPFQTKAMIEDPFIREMMYSCALNWGLDRGVSQAALDDAVNRYQPNLALPATLPPGDALVNIAGYLYPTIDALEYSTFPINNRAATKPFFDYYKVKRTQNGDGTVTSFSAQVEGSKNWYQCATHQSLFSDVVDSGWLWDRIEEEVTTDTYFDTVPGTQLPDQQRLVTKPQPPLAGAVAPAQEKPTPLKRGVTTITGTPKKPTQIFYGVVRRPRTVSKPRTRTR
jgi:pimeloyl-ACP methyl ester carboxylesterase